MTQATVHQAKTQLSKLIKQALEGEDVIIARGNKPLVRLVPIAQDSSSRAQAFGWYKDKYRISPDFDAPLEDFRTYSE